MTALYLHLSFNFEGRDSPYAPLQEQLNNALDWVRYAPNCYILYTTTDAQTWYSRLKAIVHADDSILIVEINLTNRQGWLPKYVWDWINKDRSSL
jgi:hypothetical protein